MGHSTSATGFETTTEPKRQDQPNHPVTRFEYDGAGNKTKVTFPDQKTQQWLYHDAFGQPRQFIDERANPTDLTTGPWGLMKKLSEVITHGGVGAANQSTRFYYDLMGRPQTTSFPDTTTEINTYEFGQLKTWKTRKDQVKTISYDARGREISNSWSTAPSDHPPPLAPGITRIWDDANRLSQDPRSSFSSSTHEATTKGAGSHGKHHGHRRRSDPDSGLLPVSERGRIGSHLSERNGDPSLYGTGQLGGGGVGGGEHEHELRLLSGTGQ